jgi:hypothetical protein
MFVRWQYLWLDRQRKTKRRFRRVAVATAHAVLVESVRVKGKPRQRHVAYLGSFYSKQDVGYRAKWWQRMTAKLDALGNVIPADDRPRIEAALAKNVSKLTPKELASYKPPNKLTFAHTMEALLGTRPQ